MQLRPLALPKAVDFLDYRRVLGIGPCNRLQGFLKASKRVLKIRDRKLGEGGLGTERQCAGQGFRSVRFPFNGAQASSCGGHLSVGLRKKREEGPR